MKKRVLVLILLLAVLTSGCVTLRIETKIKADGSGTKSFIMALDKDVISMMESMAEESSGSTDEIWSGISSGADLIPGAKVEDYSDDKVEGIKVSVPFANLKELEALNGSEAFAGTDVVTTSQDDAVNTMTLKAVVTAGDMTSAMGDAGGQEMEGFDMSEIKLEYTYSIDVEGKILSYGPKDIAEVKGSKITWDLSQVTADTIELTVTWKPGGGSDMPTMLLIAIAVGGVALVAVGIILAMRGKQQV